VDKRTFIHVFLIAALCFSQLAANVHMVGHFQDSPEVNFASFTTYSAQSHSHTVHHHSHRTVAEPAWEDHAKKHHLIAEHTGRIYGAVSDNAAASPLPQPVSLSLHAELPFYRLARHPLPNCPTITSQSAVHPYSLPDSFALKADRQVSY